MVEPSSHSETTKQIKSKKFQLPDTLIIIFFIGVLTALATYFVPVGSFSTQTVQYVENGVEKTRTVIDPSSFTYAVNEQGEQTYHRVALFASGDEIGLLNFPFAGLTSGDKNSSAVGIIMFMLIIGGAFGVILKTGTIDKAILRLIDKTRGNNRLFIPAMFFLFSACGAVFGMTEECIAFALIISPLMIRLGYDSIITMMCTYVATQIGFGTSWMNPFCVIIAQGIADVPVMSGATLRICLWFSFTLFGALFTMRYAKQLQHNPRASYSYHSDTFFRNQLSEITSKPLSLGDWLILLTLASTCVWVAWGVITQGWFIAEIATQFLIMGLVSGGIAVLCKLNNLTLNETANAFREGAALMIGPSLLVGLAKGLLLLISSNTIAEPSVLNSLLHVTAESISHLNQAAAAWSMLLFQTMLDFFIPSGTGQAALTMPLMAPLSDIIGVSRQTAVLAFQLGDGFANIIIPTSAALMGTLGVCRLEWGNWIRFSWRFFALLFLFASIVMVVAHYCGYQ